MSLEQRQGLEKKLAFKIKKIETKIKVKIESE